MLISELLRDDQVGNPVARPVGTSKTHFWGSSTAVAIALSSRDRDPAVVVLSLPALWSMGVSHLCAQSGPSIGSQVRHRGGIGAVPEALRDLLM